MAKLIREHDGQHVSLGFLLAGMAIFGMAMFHHDAVTRLGRHTASAIYDETLKQIDRSGRGSGEGVTLAAVIMS